MSLALASLSWKHRAISLKTYSLFGLFPTLLRKSMRIHSPLFPAFLYFIQNKPRREALTTSLTTASSIEVSEYFKPFSKVLKTSSLILP